MFSLGNFFAKYFGGETQKETADDRLHEAQLASAALMFEVIRADETIQPEEIEAFRKRVSRHTKLTSEEIDDLVELAKNEAEEAVSLYQFTSKINRYFSPKERVSLIENMWYLACSDGKLDKHEEHAIRKVSELIYVAHADFIHARKRARRHFLESDPEV